MGEKKEIGVLIVEDDDMLRKALKRFLMNDERLRVSCATEPSSGAGLFKAASGIRIVLSDFQMGNLTGHDLYAEIVDEVKRRNGAFFLMSGDLTQAKSAFSEEEKKNVTFFEKPGLPTIAGAVIQKAVELLDD